MKAHSNRMVAYNFIIQNAVIEFRLKNKLELEQVLLNNSKFELLSFIRSIDVQNMENEPKNDLISRKAFEYIKWKLGKGKILKYIIKNCV